MTERQRRETLIVIATIVISMTVMFVAAITYTTYAIGRNNAAICEIIVTSATPLPDPPQADAQTPLGEDLKRYNNAVSARAKKIQAARIRAIKKYDC